MLKLTRFFVLDHLCLDNAPFGKIWMSELSHFNVQDTANKPQCKADRNEIIIIITYNSRNVMSYSISTLLIRSLRDVFGENDPTRRRAAIDEIYNEDCTFYDPTRGVFRGRDEINRIASEIRATHPDFQYQPITARSRYVRSASTMYVY